VEQHLSGELHSPKTTTPDGGSAQPHGPFGRRSPGRGRHGGREQRGVAGMEGGRTRRSAGVTWLPSPETRPFSWKVGSPTRLRAHFPGNWPLRACESPLSRKAATPARTTARFPGRTRVQEPAFQEIGPHPHVREPTFQELATPARARAHYPGKRPHPRVREPVIQEIGHTRTCESPLSRKAATPTRARARFPGNGPLTTVRRGRFSGKRAGRAGGGPRAQTAGRSGSRSRRSNPFRYGPHRPQPQPHLSADTTRAACNTGTRRDSRATGHPHPSRARGWAGRAAVGCPARRGFSGSGGGSGGSRARP
jgi:hypothetical protein